MIEATAPKRRRPRGEGSIYRRTEGGWRGAIVTTDPDTGTRVRRVVSGRTQAEVRERMAALRQQLEATGRPATTATVADYLATWLTAEERRIRAATWRAREYHVRAYIDPAIGAIALTDLRPSDVERLTTTMVTAGRSGLTARHVRATLRRALGDALRDGLVTRNVAALARPPRVQRRELQVLSAEDTRRLLDGTVEDEFGPIYALAATTGLRQGELLGLSWGDFVNLDGAAPTLTVRRTLARVAGGGWGLAEPKTARSRRTLVLGPTTAMAVRRQRVRQMQARLAAGELWQDKAQFVFTDAIGRPLAGVEVTRTFSATLARLGLPHVRFHDLRHGVASMMLAEGVPLKLVSDALGHSGIAITADVYAHLSHEQRREAADAIERALR